MTPFPALIESAGGALVQDGSAAGDLKVGDETGNESAFLFDGKQRLLELEHGKDHADDEHGQPDDEEDHGGIGASRPESGEADRQRTDGEACDAQQQRADGVAEQVGAADDEIRLDLKHAEQFLVADDLDVVGLGGESLADQGFFLTQAFAVEVAQASDHGVEAVVERQAKQATGRDDDDRGDASRDDSRPVVHDGHRAYALEADLSRG